MSKTLVFVCPRCREEVASETEPTVCRSCQEPVVPVAEVEEDEEDESDRCRACGHIEDGCAGECRRCFPEDRDDTPSLQDSGVYDHADPRNQ